MQASDTTTWYTQLYRAPMEYMRESSVHGFSYVADKKLHVVERLQKNQTIISSLKY